MRMVMFSIFDSAIEAYSPPFFNRAVGAALRDFIDEVNNPNSRINKSPEHFSLWEIGDFDDNRCLFTHKETITCIARAHEHLKPKD